MNERQKHKKKPLQKLEQRILKIFQHATFCISQPVPPHLPVYLPQGSLRPPYWRNYIFNMKSTCKTNCDICHNNLWICSTFSCQNQWNKCFPKVLAKTNSIARLFWWNTSTYLYYSIWPCANYVKRPFVKVDMSNPLFMSSRSFWLIFNLALEA